MDLESLLSNSSLLTAVVAKINEWADVVTHSDILVAVIAVYVLYKAIKSF